MNGDLVQHEFTNWCSQDSPVQREQQLHGFGKHHGAESDLVFSDLEAVHHLSVTSIFV